MNELREGLGRERKEGRRWSKMMTGRRVRGLLPSFSLFGFFSFSL